MRKWELTHINPHVNKHKQMEQAKAEMEAKNKKDDGPEIKKSKLGSAEK